MTACPGGGDKGKGDKGKDDKGKDDEGKDDKGKDDKGKDDKAPPCTGKLKKVVAGGETTYAKLSCTGTCPDGTKCEWKKTTDHHGATREWCGCDPVEPDDECYIVLYTPADGKAAEPVCPPRDCKPNETCTPKETKTAEADGKKVYSVTCACE